MRHQDSDQHDSTPDDLPRPGGQQGNTASHDGPANPVQPEDDPNVAGPND